MTQIPIIDIGPTLRGEDDTDVVAAVAHATMTVGFMQIVNHGVDPQVIDDAFEALQNIANLDDDTKATLASPTGHHFRGLVRLVDEDGSMRAETYQACVVDDADDAARRGIDRDYWGHFHPNVWPDIDGFRARWTAMSEATYELGMVVLSLMARSLGLSPDYFVEAFRQDSSLLGGNIYPPQPFGPDGKVRETQYPHADSGVVTMLSQRGDFAGLEVLTTEGDWETVPVREDAFVINVGELMHRWSNGKLLATVHRVVSGGPDRSRMSIAKFLLPAVDWRIAPIPELMSDGQPAKPEFVPISPFESEANYIRRLGYKEPARSMQ